MLAIAPAGGRAAPAADAAASARVDDQLQRFFSLAAGTTRFATVPARFDGADATLAADADEIFWDGMELCGNGVVDTGEQCDRSDFGGATCLNYGFTSGTLSCSKTCQIDASQCSGACPVACTTDVDCGVCGPCIPLGAGTGFCAL